MNALNQKISEIFAGLVVRKDLVKLVKGNAIVPTYVLEYLLGQYCATSDQATLESGIETVRSILSKHYVQRADSQIVRSAIKETGRQRVIDKISAVLNDRQDVYEASFFNLGIKQVLVDSGTIKKYPKLLAGGVWCIADVEYRFVDGQGQVPWGLGFLKPIQMANVALDQYLEARQKFTTDEWIDLLIQSLGYNPEKLTWRQKMLQLVRLVPFCERNYNLIELGPKGTGKSHVYSEFSPHGMLLSGGEVTAAKLFVNNASGQIGLLGYWDCVAFDEFAGKQKRVDKALVDIMKNYMANKCFSRGTSTIGAEASLVFVGNTGQSVQHMLKHNDLFYDLPDKYYDSAFLDRLHFYIPGWEVGIIRSELFCQGYGFVVDYLAEILRTLRSQDFSGCYGKKFTLSSKLSTRDRDGICKTVAGLVKILFPSGEVPPAELEKLLHLAVEGRKRVKDQLLRIDRTYDPVVFGFSANASIDNCHLVETEEEKLYPDDYHRHIAAEDELDLEALAADTAAKPESGKSAKPSASSSPAGAAAASVAKDASPAVEPQTSYADSLPRLRKIQKGQTGVSFASLFGPYFKRLTKVDITDPFIRNFRQLCNFAEFLQVVCDHKAPDSTCRVHLRTSGDDDDRATQEEFLSQLKALSKMAGLELSYEYCSPRDMHDRYFDTDEWHISLGRGLDIFDNWNLASNKAAARFGACRPTYEFEVHYHTHAELTAK